MNLWCTRELTCPLLFFLPFFGFVSGLFLFRCLGIHAVWGLGTWPGFGFGFGFGLSGLDYHNWRNDKMEWDDYYHQRSSSRHHLRGEYRHSVHMKHYNNTMFIQTLTFSSFTNPPQAIDGSHNDVFETWLLWSMSLIPSAPPSLLAKKTSSVAGTQIGTSCANAKV